VEEEYLFMIYDNTISRWATHDDGKKVTDNTQSVHWEQKCPVCVQASCYWKSSKSAPTVSGVHGLKPFYPWCVFHCTRLENCQSDISQMAPAEPSFAVIQAPD